MFGMIVVFIELDYGSIWGTPAVKPPAPAPIPLENNENGYDA